MDMAYNTVLTGSGTGSPHCGGDESLRNGSAGASHNGGTLYGYARVSAQDQRLARQLDALGAFGVRRENVYADKASGRDFDRPTWRALMDKIGPGDMLIIKSIDRLGRNTTRF